MSEHPAGWIRVGVWLVPAYGLLIGLGTLRPQPDQVSETELWASFVSSPTYLLEHLAVNVIGPVLLILGLVALGAVLLPGRSRRATLWGVALTISGNVLLMVPGSVSTFVTPAIGSAYLAGQRDVMALQFPSALGVVFGIGLLITLIGGVLVGVAAWRSGRVPRAAAGVWIAGTVTFYLLGAALGLATTGASLPSQPVGGLLLAVGGGWMAWKHEH